MHIFHRQHQWRLLTGADHHLRQGGKDAAAQGLGAQGGGEVGGFRNPEQMPEVRSPFLGGEIEPGDLGRHLVSEHLGRPVRGQPPVLQQQSAQGQIGDGLAVGLTGSFEVRHLLGR